MTRRDRHAVRGRRERRRQQRAQGLARSVSASLIALPMLVLAWIYVARLIEFRTDLTGHPGTPAETGLALFVALVLLIGGRLAWFTVQRGLELPVLAIVVMSLLSITTVLGLTISP